jgi:hypothetical protein
MLALRIPPDLWVLVDSFDCDSPRRAAGEFLLQHFGGKLAAVVLTHPHRDHCDGIVDLIEFDSNAVLACVHPNDSDVPGTIPIDAIAYLKKCAQPAYTRIWDEWTKAPHRRRDTFRKDDFNVGGAVITSLHPERPLTRPDWSRDQNELSSAMLVKWHDLRLLLGADVPASMWPEIAAAVKPEDLSLHAAFKVSHHGSRAALHDSFGTGDRQRCWIVTPFYASRLPQHVDNAKDGSSEGLARILTYVDQVSVTALPFRHVDEGVPPPIRKTRAEIANLYASKSGWCDPRETKEALDRYVFVGFDKTGAVQDTIYGPGSVVITR